uniref:Sex determination protein tasselseed-2 n=1 Tax=Anthurium amnicola TaxID=1678845 RepID=A0A1D1XTE2_9ARAE
MRRAEAMLQQLLSRRPRRPCGSLGSIRRLSSTQTPRLAGQVALITGAASGIGRATAAEFIREGAKVVIADVQHQLGRAAAAELGPDAAFVGCDVSDESQVAAAVDFAVALHGHLDVVHNNAGVAGSLARSILDLDLADLDRTMAVNFRGAAAGIKHAARVMAPRGRGCILCTASMASVMGGVAPHGYSVSKAAVAGLVRTAAGELCGFGVRVNAISPYAVMTPGFGMGAMRELFPGVEDERLVEAVHGGGVMKGAACEARDVARAAVYLASDDGRYVSGHNLVVDGAFTAFKTLPLAAGLAT